MMNGNDIKITSNINTQAEFINFKQPQNEIFKELDGKIQQIVAAHSNFGRYVLGDYSSRTPPKVLELPPKLPPPPPCIPKAPQSAPISLINKPAKVARNTVGPSNVATDVLREDQNPSVKRMRVIAESGGIIQSNYPNMSKDLDFVRQCQKRQLEQQQLHQNQNQSIPKVKIQQTSTPASKAPQLTPVVKVGPANKPTAVIKVSELAQLIKQTFEANNKNIDFSERMGDDEREKLLDCIKQHIEAITKTSTSSTLSKPQSLSTPRSSTQSKSNPTIKSPQMRVASKGTSLLLNKQNRPHQKSGPSLLAQNEVSNANQNAPIKSPEPTQISRGPVMMKVVVSPSEYLSTKPLRKDGDLGSSSKDNETPMNVSKQLDFKFLRNRIKTFKNKFHRDDLQSTHSLPSFLRNPESSKKKSTKLESIVERLASKAAPKISQSENSSPQATSTNNTATAPVSRLTPIPVFSSPSLICSRSSYVLAQSNANSTKSNSIKSKQSKKTHSVGLKLNSYLEKELPQPNINQISIEQYAKFLNLVRPNDISLQKKKQEMQQSQINWTLPIANRPLRLRRMNRGERMPVGASYRASRMVGLD